MRPVFSIIIPTYNRASQLKTAIASVVKQSYLNWELIVVDDGSQDNTRELVLSFEAEPRISYHYQENKELNGARNTGVRLSAGDYCCFLDDDDYYEANHLETLSLAIGATKGNHGLYRTDMRMIGKKNTSCSPSFANDRDALVQLWETPRNLLPLAIERQLLVRFPFDENDLLIDDFVWLNTALLHTTLFQVNQVTTNYIQHETNRTKLYHSVELLPQITARLRQAYAEPGVSKRVSPSTLKLRIQHQYMHLARKLGRNGATGKAFRIWISGLHHTRLLQFPSAVKTLLSIILNPIRS